VVSFTVGWGSGFDSIMREIKFEAHKVKVNGPLADGGYSILLSIGEYNQVAAVEALAIPQLTTVQVTMSYGKEKNS